MTDIIERLIEPRSRDIGGFSVRRALPVAGHRMVGPFIFFDHMGPVAFAPGDGIDVRPHPHICLATVTYLFEGEIVHRDSLGVEQPIRPGDVNWMTAGSGIVHSERTDPARRQQGRAMHGIQSWVALPLDKEECDPAFHHHPKDTLPEITLDGAEMRLIAGEAYGATAPVEVMSPMFYLDAVLEANASLLLPDEYEQRAVYVVEGSLDVGGGTLSGGAMAILKPGVKVTMRAGESTRVMLLGGAPMDGKRHIWWNFVASSQERIERAKADWKEGRFATVPGDETEFIPLPED